MIKNLIFDFGDVFINLDKQAIYKALKFYQSKHKDFPLHLMIASQRYEVGELSTERFVQNFVENFHLLSNDEFITIWNSILLDFPTHRMTFLKYLKDSENYRLFLLSNTNELHISWIKENWGSTLYTDFKNQFEQFYLSHEIGMRKPNADIYEFVLNENKLKAQETLFIDDTSENTKAAQKLGIQVWNINPEREDVSELLNRKEFNR